MYVCMYVCTSLSLYIYIYRYIHIIHTYVIGVLRGRPNSRGAGPADPEARSRETMYYYNQCILTNILYWYYHNYYNFLYTNTLSLSIYIYIDYR